MPVKWTPETDQILLLKILETSDVSPKCGVISEKWPEHLERPTPRAISERIFKIRATAKATGTATHFSVPSANSNGGTPRKKSTATITKKTPSKKTSGPKGGANKRKRGSNMSDEEENSDDTEIDGFKSDNNGSDVSDDELPKKKTKNNATAKGKSKDPVKVKAEDTENGTAYDSNNEIENEGATDVIDYA